MYCIAWYLLIWTNVKRRRVEELVVLSATLILNQMLSKGHSTMTPYKHKCIMQHCSHTWRVRLFSPFLFHENHVSVKPFNHPTCQTFPVKAFWHTASLQWPSQCLTLTLQWEKWTKCYAHSCWYNHMWRDREEADESERERDREREWEREREKEREGVMGIM